MVQTPVPCSALLKEAFPRCENQNFICHQVRPPLSGDSETSVLLRSRFFCICVFIYLFYAVLDKKSVDLKALVLEIYHIQPLIAVKKNNIQMFHLGFAVSRCHCPQKESKTKISFSRAPASWSTLHNRHLPPRVPDSRRPARGHICLGHCTTVTHCNTVTHICLGHCCPRRSPPGLARWRQWQYSTLAAIVFYNTCHTFERSSCPRRDSKLTLQFPDFLAWFVAFGKS